MGEQKVGTKVPTLVLLLLSVLTKTDNLWALDFSLINSNHITNSRFNLPPLLDYKYFDYKYFPNQWM